jgi:hypothetical protein
VFGAIRAAPRYLCRIGVVQHSRNWTAHHDHSAHALAVIHANGKLCALWRFVVTVMLVYKAICLFQCDGL